MTYIAISLVGTQIKEHAVLSLSSNKVTDIKFTLTHSSSSNIISDVSQVSKKEIKNLTWRN